MRPGTLAPLVADIYRFGEFTVSPAQRTLARTGEAVALTGKAFDLLLFMVREPGRVLTRDELMDAVWGDTAVEERNLNQAVFTLRKALDGGDPGKPESPRGDQKGGDQRYILTIAGKGYQFVCPVEKRAAAEIEAFPNPSPNASAPYGSRPSASRMMPALVTSAAPRLEPEEFAEPLPVVLPALSPQPNAPSRPTLMLPGRSRRLRWPLALGGAVIVAGLATGIYLWRISHAPVGRIEIVMAELDNQAGDPQFDRSLDTALRIDLQQSPSLVVVGGGRIAKALGQMKSDPAAKLTAAVAREVCQRVNGNVVITPEIANVGGHYLLSMTALACSSGTTLGSRKMEVDSKAAILGAVDKLAELARRDIGESRASIWKFDKPLYETETSSLDALKVYSEAEHLFNAGKTTESIAMFQHAIEIDPGMAIAYGDMSSAYYNLGDRERSAAAITRAYALRDSVSERERFYLIFRYHQSVTGDMVEDAKVLQQWAATYPNDANPPNILSNLESWLGNGPMAARYADRYLAMNRVDGVHNASGYEISARSYMHDNQFDKALALCKEAEQYDRETGGLVGVCIEMAALRGDQAEIDRLVQKHRGTPLESRTLQDAAGAAMYRGQVKRALDLNAQAHVAAHRDNLDDDLLDIDANTARNLIEVGLPQQARDALAALPHSDEGMDATYAMAEVGDAARAEAEVEQRLKDAPNDEMLTHEYAPSVRAAAAMRQGKPLEAVALMKPDAPFELREDSVPYLVGCAYLAAGKFAEARASFKKILDDAGIDDPLTPNAPLARLQTARAWVGEGNKAAAKADYDKFLALWAGADADLPVLMQAKAERAKL